jgi:hypothetical protein
VIVVHDPLEHGYAERIYKHATAIWADADISARPVICAPGNNNTVTIVCPADGSKDDWPMSDAGDVARAELIGWLDEHQHRFSCPYWAELVMDESGDRRVSCSDESEEPPDA